MKLPTSIENLLQRLSGQDDGEKDIVRRLKTEIERLKFEQKTLEETTTRTNYRKLFSEASSTISQLILLLHLSGDEHNSLKAADILVHVKRLIAILEENGLTILGQPGEIQRFDPNQHQPIDAAFSPAPDTPVRVRFPGLAHAGVVLRKTAVDSGENQ